MLLGYTVPARPRVLPIDLHRRFVSSSLTFALPIIKIPSNPPLDPLLFNPTTYTSIFRVGRGDGDGCDDVLLLTRGGGFTVS